MTEATESVPTAEAARPHAAVGRIPRGIVEWVVIIALAVIAFLLLKAFVVEAYVIPSPSMEPAIQVHDRVLVDKLSYHLHGVHRGDIVVFTKPATDYDPGVSDLIKRVIGLPGQTLRSGPAGEIFVDGRLISQPWLTAQAKAAPGPPICGPSYSRLDCVGSTLHLQKDQYFVMGDNRGDSDDSRYFGPITGKLIIGKAVLRFWPLSRLHWF